MKSVSAQGAWGQDVGNTAAQTSVMSKHLMHIATCLMLTVTFERSLTFALNGGTVPAIFVVFLRSQSVRRLEATHDLVFHRLLQLLSISL